MQVAISQVLRRQDDAGESVLFVVVTLDGDSYAQQVFVGHFLADVLGYSRVEFARWQGIVALELDAFDDNFGLCDVLGCVCDRWFGLRLFEFGLFCLGLHFGNLFGGQNFCLFFRKRLIFKYFSGGFRFFIDDWRFSVMDFFELFFKLAEVEFFDPWNSMFVHIHCAQHEAEKYERDP